MKVLILLIKKGEKNPAEDGNIRARGGREGGRNHRRWEVRRWRSRGD